MVIVDTAQGTPLRELVDECKSLLEADFKQQLEHIGIKEEIDQMAPLDEIHEYLVLDTDAERKAFEDRRKALHAAIKIEEGVCGEGWSRAFYWFVDRAVYTFFNRIFAVRVLEALDLLKESTLVPQEDLGNLSARMKRIQEHFPAEMARWNELVLRDAFAEISKEVNILFDEADAAASLWPASTTIDKVIQALNTLDPAVYKAEDCIGWFYHYYVLKNRKEHKTMSSHGSKSPANPYYLSILNTVYTPRWMVRVLVDNSLGHWWQDMRPGSTIFSGSPFFITKVPVKLEHPTTEPSKLRILDPACGSGNFLVYTFGKLFEIYREFYPGWSCSKIVRAILRLNLFGIDINRRPAQLAALALYIAAKTTLKRHAPAELASFTMPPVNIICCDIRIPHDKNRVLFLQQFEDDRIRKVMKDVVEQFDNADQLGSLIDIRSLQKEINEIYKQDKKEQKAKASNLDRFLSNDAADTTGMDEPLNLVEIIDTQILDKQQQNIGLQLFGHQAKNAASLAQILMQKFDVIMGNPPFGLSMDITKDKLRKFYPHTYGDLVSAFIDQAHRLLKETGHIAMVTDFSFMHLPKFEKFRANLLLPKLYIQYLLVTGLAALPDARNVPVLFILRKSKIEEGNEGLYRYVEYSSSQQFVMDVYVREILEAIRIVNAWTGDDKPPKGWNRIDQAEFLNLPRSVIDLNVARKFKPLIEFFTRFPPLDANQVKNSNWSSQISKMFFGFNTGNDNEFLKNWFEVHSKRIRKAEPVQSIDELMESIDQPFVPATKGGGDLRYYLTNGYIMWWDKRAVEKIKTYDGSAIRNISYIGTSDVIYIRVSGKARGRANVVPKGLFNIGESLGIVLPNIKGMNKFFIAGYLNSKFGAFFARLQTKDRKWQLGTIARIPIPQELDQQEATHISQLSKESFELRREWDTGYPMSPVFSESLIDKVIQDNTTVIDLGVPKTGHPFCDEYQPCESESARAINKITVKKEDATMKALLDAVERRFDLLTRRLDEIDDEINKILYQLIDEDTARALDEYYDTFVGQMGWRADRDMWLKDFIMANLMDIVKGTPRGIIPLHSFKEGEKGLHDAFVDLMCKNLDRDAITIQPILKELEDLLGKDMKRWIAEEFFFYHCQRFGGRPIIWHLCSRSASGKENALDLFVDYHRITENTLPNIRVDYIEPLLRIYERRRATGTLPADDVPKCDELEDMIKAFTALEAGYPEIPNPNSLTGKKAAKGKGDDKTWAWVFGEGAKVIKAGYKPDHFLGVLVNIIPLCIDLPPDVQARFPVKYWSIFPRGTLKHVLKKLDALDQLRQVTIKPGVDEAREENSGDGGEDGENDDAGGGDDDGNNGTGGSDAGDEDIAGDEADTTDE
nr:Eco57I restriction-modification methylase domain-containing protein [Candidatus Sigynarchaeum springense]